MRVGNAATDLNLTGLTFSPDSRSLYIGTEQAIFEYDVNTRKRRGFAAGQIF